MDVKDVNADEVTLLKCVSAAEEHISDLEPAARVVGPARREIEEIARQDLVHDDADEQEDAERHDAPDDFDETLDRTHHARLGPLHRQRAAASRLPASALDPSGKPLGALRR